MRSHRSRAAFFGMACLAVGLGGGVAVGQSSPPGTPGPTLTAFPPGAVVLQGTITGTNAGVAQELPRTDYEGYVAMDLTFVLEEHRGRATGTADISGAYTGDCEFSDSTSVPMTWDSQPGPDQTFASQEGRPAYALVQVYMEDPRYAERPMTGMYLSAAAGGGGEGGTCGHTTGYVDDAFPPMRVDIIGCSFLEVLNHGGSWSGSCEEQDPSGGHISRSWTVDLAQIQG